MQYELTQIGAALRRLPIVEEAESHNHSYLSPTPISSSIRTVIHPWIKTKLQEKISGRCVHLFGHGPSLRYLTSFAKPHGHLFASMNLADKQPVLFQQLDLYMGGDMFFPTNEYSLAHGCPDKARWKGKEFAHRSVRLKECAKEQSKHAIVLLQVGENNMYHKYHGFTDRGVLNILEKTMIPIMRQTPLTISRSVMDGFSHPTTFALMQLLVECNCKCIYLYGMDCGTSHFYDSTTNSNINGTIVGLWKEFRATHPEAQIINVNSPVLEGIYPSVKSTRPVTMDD